MTLRLPEGWGAVRWQCGHCGAVQTLGQATPHHSEVAALCGRCWQELGRRAKCLFCQKWARECRCR